MTEILFSTGTLVTLILGLLSAGLVLAAANGIQLPVLSTERAMLMALLVVGIAMCTRSMAIDTYGWTNIFQIIGMALGVVVLVVAGATLLNVQLPLINDDRSAIIAIGAIMVVKVLVAVARYWLA